MLLFIVFENVRGQCSYIIAAEFEWLFVSLEFSIKKIAYKIKKMPNGAVHCYFSDEHRFLNLTVPNTE